eukprot:COSAG06_NODE_10353_length_1696_cov_24.868503_1_plen_79_part_00
MTVPTGSAKSYLCGAQRSERKTAAAHGAEHSTAQHSTSRHRAGQGRGCERMSDPRKVMVVGRRTSLLSLRPADFVRSW